MDGFGALLGNALAVRESLQDAQDLGSVASLTEQGDGKVKGHGSFVSVWFGVGVFQGAPVPIGSGVIQGAEVLHKLPCLIGGHARDHLTCHGLPGEVVGKVKDCRTCLRGGEVGSGDLSVGHFQVAHEGSVELRVL